MLKSSHSVRALASILFAFVALLATVPSARAQNDFTMQATDFSPSAIEPGGSAISTISLSAAPGFTGSVTFSPCTVTPAQTTSPPVCTVSPAVATPPASPTITVTTSGTTPSGSYTVTVTGTGGNTTQQLSLNLTVLSVTPAYTITVTGVVTPTSVHAGSGATAIITVTPVNGYTSPMPGVTLSCSAISPAATPSPYCSFNPNPINVPGTIQTSTLTISTLGPAPPTTAIPPHRIFYAVWQALPVFMLIAAGLGPTGKVRRRFLSLTVLFAIATGLFFVPACGSSNSTSTTTTSNNGTVTPKNTYTFTLSGSDANGVAPSNTPPTVSLTVN